MEETEIPLRVEQNSGQQPFGEEGAQDLQQTRGSQSFGAETNRQNQSQAEQARILELLRSEAAGPSRQSADARSGLAGTGLIFAALAVLCLAFLLIIYYRFFVRRLARIKQ